jgi:hypothetical protein
MEQGKWIKSSRSAANGQCVEVRLNGDEPATVSVRDSKNPGYAIYMFSAAAWNDFIEGVKAGQFDLA